MKIILIQIEIFTCGTALADTKAHKVATKTTAKNFISILNDQGLFFLLYIWYLEIF